MAIEALSSTTTKVETEPAAVKVGGGERSAFGARTAGAVAGAPYADEVATSVSCSATIGSTLRKAAFAVGDSVDEVGFPVPAAWLPPLVGIISTYCATAAAGRSPAAAEYGKLRTPPMPTTHPMQT